MMLRWTTWTITLGLLAAAPSAPQKNLEATFHSAPKPLAAGTVTSDWSAFLGPNHNMVCSETHLLRDLPKEGPPVVWEMKKGEGYAAPAIAVDRLVLFHRVGDEEVIDCLKADTGERFWRFSYPTRYADDYGYCNGPRSSPVIAGGRVFAIGSEAKLHCLDLETGKVLWKHDLTGEFKLKKNFFGIGSTPLVDDDKLIVNVGAPGGPCVVAFDVATGKMLWGVGKEWGASYASPVPTTLHGKHRVLVFAGGKSRPPTGGLLCIDPANGHIDFTFPWRGTAHDSVNASSPVVVGNQVFLSECYGSGGVLLDVLPDLSCKTAWTNPHLGTHFMSAIAKDGCLYAVDGHGPADAFLVCVDLKTGAERWRQQPHWKETIQTPDGPQELVTGTYRCWLMPVDGRVLCLGEYGHLLWMDLTPDGYTQRSRAWLFAAGETWTPPVVSHGLLYVCQNSEDRVHHVGPRLLCYDLRD